MEGLIDACSVPSSRYRQWAEYECNTTEHDTSRGFCISTPQSSGAICGTFDSATSVSIQRFHSRTKVVSVRKEPELRTSTLARTTFGAVTGTRYDRWRCKYEIETEAIVTVFTYLANPVPRPR